MDIRVSLKKILDNFMLITKFCWKFELLLLSHHPNLILCPTPTMATCSARDVMKRIGYIDPKICIARKGCGSLIFEGDDDFIFGPGISMLASVFATLFALCGTL